MRVEDSESHIFQINFFAVHAQDDVGSFNKMHAQAESERRYKGKIFMKFLEVNLIIITEKSRRSTMIKIEIYLSSGTCTTIGLSYGTS